MYKTLLLFLCSFYFYLSIPAQVSLTEKDWVIPTYELQPPEKNPMFFKNESFQGASRHVYPYALYDVFSTKKEEKAWKALILENEYIKICVTPEMGGKIYYGEDKSNGYNFFYKNDVVKPAHIGMIGAWVSGGIEWNVLHHHRASSFLPTDYEWVEHEDGSKTIWVGETELRHRMRWTIGLTVFPGKSYVKAQIKIYNPTPFTHSLLYWANVAVHTNSDYQVIFPPSVQVATYHSKNAFTRWPISTEMYRGRDFTSGVDISYWKNSPRSNSFFAWDLKEDFMGGYDHGQNSGLVHIGDHNIVKGAKLWEWGSGKMGQGIEAQLNEYAGPYAELMVGAFSDNQPDYSWIGPYEVKTATQYWYPIQDIKGFKNANLLGAVNMEQKEKNRVFLAYHTTQAFEQARVRLSFQGNALFEKDISISPDQPYTELVDIEFTPKNFTDLYTELIDTQTGEPIISYRPKKLAPIEDLPETVKPPLAPSEMETTEELYLTGSRLEQFYNPRLDPMLYYEEALKRDPGDIRTHTAVGNIELKKGNYSKARHHFAQAIQRLTKDYTRPSDCEALYLQGITLRKLGLYEEAIDTLYRATWDHAYHSAAYLELARISVSTGKYPKALKQVEESLSTNVRNNSALGLKTSLLRKEGKYKAAKKIIEPVYKQDPLDFRAGYEAYLIAKTHEPESSQALLKTWLQNMRDFDQNYLELAVAYLNDGFQQEAEEILLRYTGKDSPIIRYYLGYLADRRGDKAHAEEYFTEASELSTDYCFPFRLETVSVLKKALTYHPQDGKAYYYLGNIFANKQAGLAMEYWQQAVLHDPELSIAYRNLGWGYYHKQQDRHKAIEAYERALQLNQEEPMYYVELDQLYENSNTPIAKRLKLFEGNEDAVGKREDAFARQISVLTLAGKAEQAVEFLQGRSFTFNESSQEIYNIIADAQLALGIQYLRENQYERAIETFEEAKPPEELAFYSNYGNRSIQARYYTGLAYEALNKKKLAKKQFLVNTSLDPGRSAYIRYYKGLSHMKVGQNEQADEIFRTLLEEAEKELMKNAEARVDFFAKFGGQEAEHARLSQAYLLKGLGHRGLGEKDAARESLKKAVELSASNLYARIEHENK